jgi:hypothetical protein
MVRLLCLTTTRCASTMAAGTPLQGLLHGRQHTHIPLLLPLRPPKHNDCPWTTTTLPNSSPLLRMPTYSEALRRAPSPTSHRYSRQSTDHSSHNIISPSLFSIKCPKRGTRRWQLLVSRLTIPLPSLTHQQSSTTIPHCFDPIINWLPISYQRTRRTNSDDVMPPSHDPHSHIFDDLTSAWSDNTEAYYNYFDTTPTNPISDA